MRQHFTNCKYSVLFTEHSENHYCKDFKKKYKKHWEVTKQSIQDSLERIYGLSGTKLLDVICASNKSTILAKFDFKISGDNHSAKTSGNRCILEINNAKNSVAVLLIYSKDHVRRSDGQETMWWKECIQSEYELCCVA